MTAPAIRSSAIAATTHVGMQAVLPATIEAGDLILCYVASASSAWTTPSGWTSITGGTIASGNSSFQYYNIFYKIADGSEDGTTVNDGSVNSFYYYATTAISGHSSNVQYAAASASYPDYIVDPANLTLSGGSADTLWLCFCCDNFPSGTWNITAAPSGYSGFATHKASANNIARAYKTATAASENPGKFTEDYTSAFQGSVAVTIGVPYIPFTTSGGSLFFGSKF